MFDVKWIAENAEAFDQGMAARGLPAAAAQLIDLDKKRREAVTELQEIQNRRNAASKQIGAAMAAGDQATADKLKAEVSAAKGMLQEQEAMAKAAEAELRTQLSSLPNIPFADVPVGEDESDNVEVRSHGSVPNVPGGLQHFELGEQLGQMDFERAAKLSGARFTVLSGELARLERALGQFMLDLHTREHGYRETQVPLLVNSSTAFGTGQLPKFEEDLFKTTDDRYMIPTAEVPLTNLVADEILPGEELPLRYTALSPCFRSEAGSAGRDTRGMLRQHQFYKVELVSITSAETSSDELERMTSCAEEVLKRLDLHFRTMVLSTGDMGFSARKTYDLEVWLPGQGAYREISSCSVCGDFQARRMNARYRYAGEKGTQFAHTLNGSGVALGRALIAVMENYQNEDGSISVPSALQPYMGDVTKIGG